MDAIWDALAHTFDPAAFSARIAHWIPNLIVALVTLAVFFLLNKALIRGISFVMRRAEVDDTAINFVQTVASYALVAVALVTVLGQIGVDIAGLLASLGVVGLTIGFAARDALSNIISGLFILWDRPFVLGDLVEIDGAYGRVQRITMRTTRVVTPDGRMLAIPNTVIVNSTVASYTNFPHLRLDVELTVGVEEDLGRVRQLLLGVAATHPGVMESPAASVVVTALGDYNVTVVLRAWIGDESAHLPSRFALREAAFEALRSAGVDMPFETLALRPLRIEGAKVGATSMPEA